MDCESHVADLRYVNTLAANSVNFTVTPSLRKHINDNSNGTSLRGMTSL